MTLQKDQPKQPQTRSQKITMWVTYSVAGAFIIAAVIIAIVTHVKLF
jgi:hypothetical protein